MNITMREVLVFFYKKYNGNWEDIYKAIAFKERVNEAEAKEVWKEVSSKYVITTIIDDDYPMEYRKNYFKPPFVILKSIA